MTKWSNNVVRRRKETLKGEANVDGKTQLVEGTERPQKTVVGEHNTGMKEIRLPDGNGIILLPDREASPTSRGQRATASGTAASLQSVVEQLADPSKFASMFKSLPE
jgi:hypothetical protein